MLKIGVVVVAIVLFLGVAALFVMQQKMAGDAKQQVKTLEDRVAALEADNPEKDVAKDRYQAVFMTNGQVYFAKITTISKETMKLTDIFYLQGNGADAAPLAKLGDELHGPEDAMIVERKQVLFWENLKADGKVAKAIADYKKSH